MHFAFFFVKGLLTKANNRECIGARPSFFYTVAMGRFIRYIEMLHRSLSLSHCGLRCLLCTVNKDFSAVQGRSCRHRWPTMPVVCGSMLLVTFGGSYGLFLRPI